MKDYYKILGIKQNSTKEEIKKAYKKMAMKYHPDRNPSLDSEEKFKEIKEAYEYLIGKRKDDSYEEFETSFDDVKTSFGDIFEDFFDENDSFKDNINIDATYNINISLKECYFGVIKTINIPSWDICNICNGNKNSKLEKCLKCNGSGYSRNLQSFFNIHNICNACNGTGEIIYDTCSKCNGLGKIKKFDKIQINIPKGIENGSKIKIAGKGNPHPSKNIYGDLYIHINIKKNKYFKRKKNDLVYKKKIFFTKVLVGGKIKVKSLDGFFYFNLPKCNYNNKKFIIKNKGLNGGSLILKISVIYPNHLNDYQISLIKKLSKSFK
ncbi:DnaJ C-terminal domain-containing protein [Candidatus Vidania fulgoroideorum]